MQTTAIPKRHLKRHCYGFVFQPPQFGSGYSSINPDVVDLNLYPDASKVEWTYSTLGPGDCIFIPSGKHYFIDGFKTSHIQSNLY